jgi:membrane-bound ClpP family serine protease
MTALVWVALLLAVGLAVMVLEVFVPSGGALGFIAVVAIGAAVVTAFVEQGTGTGLAVLAVTCVAVPAVLTMSFRWFPETPLGRRVLPPPPAPEDVVPGAARRRRLRGLVGRSGRAVTEMLPWGSVEIDGVVGEALAEGGAIAADAPIEVVGVQGPALVVRATSPAPPAADEAAQPAAEERPAADPSSPLSRTLEEFDFERFEPPAA